MIWILLAGCVPDVPEADSESAFFAGPTSIDSVSLDCSASDDRWEIAVETTGWTAGGLFAWTADGVYLEEHPLISTAADFYGAWDELETTLSISADPRDASRGSSTALLCDAPTREGLRGWLVVYDPDTEEEVDCRVWGPDHTWDLSGYSTCEETLELAFR